MKPLNIVILNPIMQLLKMFVLIPNKSIEMYFKRKG